MLVGDGQSFTGDVSGFGEDDLLVGADGDDILFGDSGALAGSASGVGRDRLFGGLGNDVMAGDNHVHGVGHVASGSGSDYLDGEPGFDEIAGDHLTLDQASASGAGNDVIVDPDGGLLVGDSIAKRQLGSVDGPGTGADATGSGLDLITIGHGDLDSTLIGDSYTSGDAHGGGPDLLNGASGDDHLIGDNLSFGTATGGGSDYLDGRGGHNRCNGGPATDFARNCQLTTNIP